MKVLVIGSGGREHALLWKLSLSPRVDKLYCAPGNGGTEDFAENIAIAVDAVDALAEFVRSEQIDLTIVGPEAPLVKGLVDRLQAQGAMVFGPTQKAAALEGSKVFAKRLMEKYGIPTGRFQVAETTDEASGLLDSYGYPVVIKADGLAAGKGVVIARDRKEAEDAVRMILTEKAFGAAGEKILIEECLQGEEVSVLAFTDGETVVPMISAQDHKRALDNDQGLNTGGMGAYAPAPVYTKDLAEQVKRDILIPTVQAMKSEGIPYQGVIYAGLMITAEGPQVLEFNARFGDPETQVILPLLKTSLVDVVEAVCTGNLHRTAVEWEEKAAVCVVMASGGYPGEYETGKPIKGLDRVTDVKDVMVFHAGTRWQEDQLVTAGGRVLGVTALGETIARAVEKAYDAVQRIEFAEAHFRRDIAHRALHREQK